MSSDASMPKADRPGDNVFQKVGHSVQNAFQHGTEKVKGKSEEAKYEANKETAKGNTNATVGQRFDAATDAVGNKWDQKKHEGAADANKHMT